MLTSKLRTNVNMLNTNLSFFENLAIYYKIQKTMVTALERPEIFFWRDLICVCAACFR